MTYSSKFTQDPWTREKRAEFEAAMGPYVAAAGVGQVLVERGRRSAGIPRISHGIVIPQFTVGRQIAIPKSQWAGHASGGGGGAGLRDVEPPPARPMNWTAIVGWGAVLAVAAGIFWATTNQPKRVTANRRRRVRRNVSRRKQHLGGHESGYKVYTSPTGRGLGPFETRREAEEYLKEILHDHPDAFVAEVAVRGHRVKSNRRRRIRRNTTRYELVYSTGGHGGPYQSLDAAKDAAERLLRGGRDEWIAVVPHSQLTNLRAAKPTGVLYRKGGWQKRSWLPNIPAHLRENRLTKAKRRRMSRKSFVFPGRRAWPLDSQKRAKAAIAYMHMGRVGTKGDYLAIRNEIIRRYGVGFWRDAGGPSWEKIARAKAKRARTRRRRTTKRMAANRRRR